MADLERAAADYREFFTGLTDSRVERFRELAAPSVRYVDPLMDERGIDHVVRAMHGWFQSLRDIHFEILASAVDAPQAFFHWHMSFRIARMPKRAWMIDGMSRVRFDSDGKVEQVQDYWDATPLLEAVPVLGRVPTLIKRLMS